MQGGSGRGGTSFLRGGVQSSFEVIYGVVAGIARRLYLAGYATHAFSYSRVHVMIPWSMRIRLEPAQDLRIAETGACSRNLRPPSQMTQRGPRGSCRPQCRPNALIVLAGTVVLLLPRRFSQRRRELYRSAAHGGPR